MRREIRWRGEAVEEGGREESVGDGEEDRSRDEEEREEHCEQNEHSFDASPQGRPEPCAFANLFFAKTHIESDQRERGFVLERRCSETFKGVLKGGTIESDDDVEDDAQIYTSMLFIFIMVIFSLDFWKS